MVVLVTCKNEEDPFKNEDARVLTSLYVDFPGAQGQLTPPPVVESRRNSNSSKLLWLSLLPARMKKIQPKWRRKSANDISPIIKVKSMQKSGTGAIRTQIQSTKPKREITKITNSQNTKSTYG